MESKTGKNIKGGAGGSEGADDDHGGDDEGEGDYKDGDNLVKCCWTLAVADPLVHPSALLPMLRCSILHKDIQTTMCLYFNICCIFMSRCQDHNFASCFRLHLNAFH